MFSQVRIVYLIFAVPQTQEQIFGFFLVTSTIDATVTLLRERILLFLTVLAFRTSGVNDEKGLWLACQSTGNARVDVPTDNAVFCSFEQSDVGSRLVTETQKSHRNEKNEVT